jgi:hypothetical protein
MLRLHLREEVGPHDSQHYAGRCDRKQTPRSRSSLSGSTSWVPWWQAGTRWRLRKHGLQLPTVLGECLVAVNHGGEGRGARGQGWLRGDTEHAADRGRDRRDFASASGGDDAWWARLLQ